MNKLEMNYQSALFRSKTRSTPNGLLLLVGFLGLFTQVTDARAQAKIGRDGNAVQGQTVPRDVREIYDRGLLWRLHGHAGRVDWL